MYDYEGKPREYRIFGLQRSGTYYLEFFIRENLNIKCGNKGKGELWKHSPTWPVDIDLERETFFPIHKNPYLWCESIITKNVDYVTRQTMFPAMKKGNSNEMCNDFNVRNLAKQYAYWYDQWFVELPSDHRKRTYSIKYEDLLTHVGREGFLHEVANNFNIKRKSLSTISNPNNVTLSGKFTKEKERKYLNGEISFLSKPNIRVINEELPDKLFSELGYKRQ